MATEKITIVIPILNEELTIRKNLVYLRSLHTDYELLFVDGNSSDSTVQLLQDNQFKVITSSVRGRGAQISLGGSNAGKSTELILFLHIDTRLPQNFESMILRQTDNNYWGRFDVKLDSDKAMFKIIEWMMNKRAQLTGIATGDQAIFVSKNEFIRLAGNIAEYPLMEDIYLSKMLKKRLGRGIIIKSPVTTSVRYWEINGVFSTILKMWKYRLMYFFGVSPAKLYQRYYK